MSEERPVQVSKTLSFMVRAAWIVMLIALIIMPASFIVNLICAKGAYLLQVDGLRIQYTDLFKSMPNLAPGSVKIYGYTPELIGNESWIFYLGWPIALVEVVVSFLIITKLLSLIKIVESGQPFSSRSPVLIKQIGVMVLLCTVVDAILTTAISFFLKNKIPIPDGADLIFFPSIDFHSLFLGLVLLLLARIFKGGVDLQQEHDLTV